MLSPLNIFIQISLKRCLCNETVNGDESSDWSEKLYELKAAELILYGRALGLSHAEAEDVLQETFLVLMQRPQPPLRVEHYCVRSFRNRALNYRRSLWRRLHADWNRGDGLKNPRGKIRWSARRCGASPNCRWNSAK